jgi:hypothetical protein
MTRDTLDRWLSDEETIVPSSGFTERVMDAVRHEALAPPAIPFPWARALPGVVALVVSFALIIVFGISSLSSTIDGGSGLSLFLIDGVASSVSRWLLVSALVTVLPILWSLRFMRT